MATRKRLTKTLLLRIFAVGLFICLGTFAVMHSIHNQNKKNAEVAEKDESDGGGDAVIPVVDAGKNKAIATVGGTEDGTGNAPKNTIPGFKPPIRPNPLTPGSQSSVGGKSSSSSLIPPFRPSTGTGSASTGTGSSRPFQSPGMTRPPARSIASQGKDKNTGFVSSGNSSRAGSNSGNSLIPPFRPNTGSSNTPIRPGAAQPRTSTSGANGSSGFSATPRSTSTQNSSVPPIRPTMPPGGTSRSIGEITRSPIRTSPGSSSNPPANQTDPFARRRTSDQSVTGSGTRSTTGNTRSPIQTMPSRPVANRATQSNQNDPFAPSSSRPGIPARQIKSSRPNQPVTSTPTRALPTQQPIRNVSSPAAPIMRQTQSTLASAPVGRSNIAKPTPGDRNLEGVQAPALAVQKIAPREVQVNREATFELVVRNTGKATADNVQVHDYVPAGTRLIEAMPPANAGSDGQITWNLGSLAPGQQTSIKMKLLPERAGNIGSVAHVTFGAVASAQTICTQPRLSIRHEAPQTVLLGQTMMMNIIVENKGDGAAENVVLQEDVPEGLEFAGGQKELEYAIGTLPPGQSRRIQLPLRAAKVGQARNVLVAHGAGNLQATDTVDVRVIAPQLTLNSDGPIRKFLNRKATHTFSVGNQGSAAATNVQMVARLPRGLQFVEANNGGAYDRNSHAVYWKVAKLDSQKTGQVQLTTMPVAVGQHEINLTAAADLNQRQQATQSLAVQQLSELFFDIDDTADAIEVGSGTTYRVRVVNQGQIPATNVQVRVEFAPAIKPIDVQGAVRHQIRGQTVVLDPIPSLLPGKEISFVVSANALQAGEHRTVLSVESDDREIAVSKQESTHVYSDR